MKSSKAGSFLIYCVHRWAAEVGKEEKPLNDFVADFREYLAKEVRKQEELQEQIDQGM